MEKIKKWFIKHKRKLLCVLLLLCVWLHGLGTASCMQRLTASADVNATYLPPSVSCQYSSTGQNIDQFPIFAPLYPSNNTLVVADHYAYFYSVNYWFYPQIYLNQGYNVFDLTATGESEEILLNYCSLYFTNWVTDRVNTGVPLVVYYSSFGALDVSYSVEIYNPTHKAFNTISGLISPIYIEADNLYDYTLILSVPESYFLEDSNCVYIRSLNIYQTLYSTSAGITTGSHTVRCEFHSTDKDSVNNWFSALSSTAIVETRWDVLGSIVDSVDSFLETEILPNFSFYDILLIGLSIPLLIAILKLWLGG